ncbi:hypothetical protein [Dysgonomonas macrotermitis]|uniref:Uncharacterized protein n=1 Tax=Dysgonomonas macrotermitis TaxID=1346286 RepID=A0A1M5EDB4_9BACT|nr:hypothetical protein [Dysgonomonas macrotermitis]SHF77239.1 hypothetical protein SAMN05444362_1102 [Dysgonomonas macrotermitis]
MRNILGILILTALPVMAQIGVNTETPYTLFHLDARYTATTTNPDNAVPSNIQQQDDVVITEDGKVGIGTITPGAKFEVNTQNVAGMYPLQITDTSDPTGKVLVSDSNGNALWTKVQPPRGTVYPIIDIPASTIPAGSEQLVPNSEFTVPHDGFFSYEIRWWSYYSAAYATASRISIVLILKRNGVTVDSFRYQTPFIGSSAITSYIPLYSTANANDKLALYIHSVEGPGNVMTQTTRQWTTPRILVKELQMNF